MGSERAEVLVLLYLDRVGLQVVAVNMLMVELDSSMPMYSANLKLEYDC